MAAAGAASVVNAVNVEITPGVDIDGPDEVKTVLVSVQTPPASQRSPVDVVVVLDISGSMGAEATIQSAGGQTESHGLTLLDVAKHGVKTIVQTLNQNDRLSVVTFNHNAELVFGLTVMDDDGRKVAIEKVDSVHQGGTTDIWKGLHAGMEALREGSDGSRCSHIMLLTDGESSNKEAIIPQLQEYKKSEAKTLPGTINTFGFGYNLDSLLLTRMADEGLGSYSFIPDAGFVGTVFVNTMSNLLVTMGVKALLTLEAEESATTISVRGTYTSLTPDNTKILIGSLQYEQSRDIVLELKNVTAQESYLCANVSYVDISGNPVDGGVCDAKVLKPSDAQKLAVERHRIRSLYVESVRDAVRIAEQGRSEQNLQGAAAIIQSLTEAAESSSSSADDAGAALCQDIKGQTTEAFSKMEWYWKWGRHYVPSIMFAHKLQQCNNFKDPGVQKYGGDLFQSVQDEADKAFNDLPAPTPSRPRQTYGTTASSAAAPVSMAAYNDRFAG